MMTTNKPEYVHALTNLEKLWNLDKLTSGDNLKESLTRYGSIFSLESKKSFDKEFPLSHKVYILASGGIFLSCIGRDGRKVILDSIKEGTIFGDLTFLNNTETSINYLFIEPFPKSTSVVLEFTKNDFLNIMLDHPILVVRAITALSIQTSKLEEKIEEIVFFSLKSRVLMELTRLGEPVDGEEKHVKVKLKLTHEKLAEALGAVRETVSKAITELKKEGLIFYDKRKNFIVRTKKKEGQEEKPPKSIKCHL